MARIKTTQEIEYLREGGKRLAKVVKAVSDMVRPGIATDEIDKAAEQLIRDGGDTPAFLGYAPRGADRGFPGTVCISINEEVVHGIPNEDIRTIEDGDIVSLDCGLVHHGLITDHAVSVIAGEASKEDVELLTATRDSLMAGIAAAKPGKRVGDISAAIEEAARKHSYGIVYELGGHGVGHKVHEEPYIPNLGEAGVGDELVVGMVLAIEPMLTHGTADVKLLRDGYTFVTRDGSRAAHFEHTIVIGESGSEIITIV